MALVGLRQDTIEVVQMSVNVFHLLQLFSVKVIDQEGAVIDRYDEVRRAPSVYAIFVGVFFSRFDSYYAIEIKDVHFHYYYHDAKLVVTDKDICECLEQEIIWRW